MRFSLVDGRIARPTPGARGTCEACGAETVAKCGAEVTWHWAHLVTSECTGSGMSAWHRWMQDQYPDDWVEDPETPGRRADVRVPDEFAIEFQHSPITPDEIRQREKDHGRVLWVFDISEPYEQGRLRFQPPTEFGYQDFEWESPRRHIAAATTAILDRGACDLFLVVGHSPGMAHGYGRKINREFLRMGRART